MVFLTTCASPSIQIEPWMGDRIQSMDYCLFSVVREGGAFIDLSVFEELGDWRRTPLGSRHALKVTALVTIGK